MKKFSVGGVMVAAAVLFGCASISNADDTASIEEQLAKAPISVDFGMPFFRERGLPNALDLVPDPPAEGSVNEARDIKAMQDALILKDSPRWSLAARDADLGVGAVPRAFSCAAGIAISAENTPALYNLMKRVISDMAMSTNDVKDTYARPRPFMVNGKPTCTPEAEPHLRTNGSYPSGHSALGYGIGLTLASIFPDNAAHLVARGRAFGESRRICNVHWLSDVEEGRVIATATYARLQSSADYQAEWAKAKAEVDALGDAAPKPTGCDEEAAALALDSWM